MDAVVAQRAAEAPVAVDPVCHRRVGTNSWLERAQVGNRGTALERVQAALLLGWAVPHISARARAQFRSWTAGTATSCLLASAEWVSARPSECPRRRAPFVGTARVTNVPPPCVLVWAWAQASRLRAARMLSAGP
eukprot:scaffold13582_cov22-Tisochrysis_lutea.AAC.4